MNKELQDRAWRCLPKEFKEEVKKMWQSADKKQRLPHDAFLRGNYSTLVSLFGYDNLTSDAEEDEEMLYVSRKQIDALQGEIFKAIMDAHDADDWQDAAHYILDVMPRSFAALFGSKCLPDEKNIESLEPKANSNYTPIPEKTFVSKWNKTEPKPAEPKFHVGDEVRCLLDGKYYRVEGRTGKYYYILSGCGNGVHEDYLIPYKPAQPASQAAENVKNSRETASESKNRESDHIADADKMMDGIIANGFRNERRCNIAVQMVKALTQSPEIVDCISSAATDSLLDDIISDALYMTDKLIAACEKGEEK